MPLDFRSDTITRPSQQMRQAMLEAEVGDDVYGEDPSVQELQAEAARLTGKEAALLVPSGTMGNLSAVLAHCSERGSEVILGDESHIYVYEAGGLSVLGGVPFHVVPNTPTGELPLNLVRAAIRPDDQHAAVTRCVCIEDTHNRCGGSVLSLDYLDDLSELCQSNGLALHMDGARVFNAATALGVPVERITSRVTSVQFCLSKGLGAPVGSMVAGPADFIAKVHKYRKMLGGGMRQAGVLAAPGLIALRKMTKRLHEDHANAKTLAEGIGQLPWAIIEPASVQTNIVCFQLKPPMTVQDLQAHTVSQGLQILAFKGGIRMVTHCDVSSEDVQAALKILQDAQASCKGHAATNGALQNGHVKPEFKAY